MSVFDNATIGTMPSQSTAQSTATEPSAAPNSTALALPSGERADEVTERTRAWFAVHRRDLPWREPTAGPWAVMVSEFMLQQTPVARVLPAYQAWLARWPTPSALAADEPGEAVRAWGRLGYPRRALRLHGAAVAIVEHHGGEVPADSAQLRTLPGVGEYTAEGSLPTG